MNKKQIILGAKLELARREFFFYCHLKAPDFYNINRKYLVELCNEFQDFYQGQDDILIVNLPPRHGKSRTASYFVEWVLGKNINEKIMTGSYNETLSTMFSKNVRNDIQEEKADLLKPVYNDVFPKTRIKQGDGAMNLWSLEGGYNNYLATSPTGTATGFGCSLMIIDDLIKNAEEAYNESVKEKHWDWFNNTMLSRLEEGGKIIVIMTRWASDDLAGKILDEMQHKKIKHISMKAMRDDGSMLCDAILSEDTYKDKIRTMGVDIASANYQQEPIDIKGRLYSSFKTYDRLPDTGIIKCYIDTADTGSDYLCAIVYMEYDKEAYVVDVLYTKDGMAVTEGQTAKMLYERRVSSCLIEGNNGGEGFKRSVERILKEKYKSNLCRVKTFHQSKNKAARILSYSTWVENHIYFPAMWKNKWFEYYKAMSKYQKEGKNKHDDAPDATTGVAEQFNKSGFKVLV